MDTFTLSRTVNDAIDLAIIKRWPEYAEASNVSGMAQEFVKGTLDYLLHTFQSPREFRDFAIGEAYELVGLARLISNRVRLVSENTTAILYSAFVDDMNDFDYCVDTLHKCVFYITS